MKDSTKIGPNNGSLVIIGGGGLEPAVVQRFLDLSGGPQEPIIITPTAGDRDHYGPAQQGAQFRPFTEQGATNLRLLHAHDRDEANSDTFVQAIREAQGIFFWGGRHWRLTDVYLNTKTEQALWDLLDRGGCIAGTSAGATMLGSYMLRGDTKGNLIMVGDHVQGFGFLKDVTIDQHLLQRNRQFDLIEVIRAKPELLGIGIDEGTAIVVQDDQFEVVGRSYVAIYDYEAMGEQGHFYFLAPGDRFDLTSRVATRSTSKMSELWLPQIHEKVPVESGILTQYVGNYQSSELQGEVSIVGDRLFGQISGQSKLELIPISEHTFYDEAEGRKIVFNVNEAGEVESVTIELPGSKAVLPKIG